MLQEQIQNTKKVIEKLASETGKPIDQILKCLSQTDFSELPKTKSFQKIINEGTELSQKDNSNLMASRKSVKRNVFANESQTFIQTQQDGRKHHEAENELKRSIQLIETTILELNKISSMIMQNVVEQMATKKIYKIRQNFRDLVLSILGVQQFSFYASHESGRVEFQDFSSNFITQIMQNDNKCEILFNAFTSAPSEFIFVDLADNSDLVKLFNIGQVERGHYFGLVTESQGNHEENNLSLCLMIKADKKDFKNILNILVPKLINKIIDISQINISEDSAYITSKNYMKKMLDLLQILIVQFEIRLKKSLINQNKHNKDLYYSVNNIIKIILSKVQHNLANEELIPSIRKLTNQFEQTQYKKIEEIRMYKKYVREHHVILLQFNRIGTLLFLSGNKDNPYLNTLTNVWQEGKPILDLLFSKNQKLDANIKKAIRGSFKSERPFQIDHEVKAKITVNGKRIEKIQIILQDSEGSTPSTSNFDSPIEKPAINEKRQNKINSKTMKQIEKQNPGITKEGWIDLFLKIVPMKQQRRSSSSMSKKSNTYFNSRSQSQNIGKMNRFLSFEMSKQEHKNFLAHIAIDNININFLNFNDEQLDIFVIRILENLDYFKKIPQQKAKLQHFISELHDNYEIHSNPFHNFKHGVNVMHTCYLLSTMPANFNILSIRDIFVNVFSGLCHDVGHTGFTNAFEIASMSRKAMIYNDRSPLENFHASLTFEILRKEQNNFLSNMDREQFILFRKGVIQNILFTDIKQHFPLLNNFNELLKSGKGLSREDAPLLSYIIVHSSDFAGSIKQFQICKEWSLRVNKQFTNQYQMQGEIGIPQTPFMKDLTNPLVLSKAEGGFLKVIVYPLYQSLDKLYITEGIVHKYKKNIEENIKSWEELNRTETEKKKLHQQQQNSK